MKTANDTAYVYALVAEGEHQRQDFKYEISDARKIAKTLSAFANTDGGRLLIGVKDNGKIAGVQTDEEAYMMEAAADLYCRPKPNCRMRTCLAEGRNILIVEVEESSRKPVCAQDESGKWLAYLRRADENILATPVHLQVWRQEGDPCGELTEFAAGEQQLLDVLDTQGALALGRCCRLAGLSHRTTVRLLAKFIRYGIVEADFTDHKFTFRLKR